MHACFDLAPVGRYADLAILIFRALECHWCRGAINPPVHWLADWVHLIPKPGKSITKPAALRPIYRQYPIIKVVSGLLTKQSKYNNFPQLSYLSLYTYLPHRGTIEYLLRISQHCREVRQCGKDYLKDPDRIGLFGGLQISLDMEKLFDSINREIIQRVLDLISLPFDVLSMLQTWLIPHKVLSCSRF